MATVMDTNDGDVRMGAIWEDAWELVPGTKRIYLLMTVIVLLISAAVGFLVGTVLESVNVLSGSFGPAILVERYANPATILIQVLTAPLLAWYASVGLQVTKRERPDPGQWFRALDRWPKLIALMTSLVLAEVVLVVVLGSFGGFLATLIYFCFAFGPFFIIDQDSSIFEAMTGSFAIVSKNLGHYILYLVVVWLLGAVGALTLGIAYLWFFPFFSISSALIYRRAAATLS